MKMLTTRHLPAAALAFCFTAGTADAQPQGPPVRELGPVTASTTDLRSITGVRALSTGHVLVNDAQSRRVLLFAPGLSGYTVVADSTSATGNAYSGQFAGLVPYAGDSTLFVDAMSMSMLVLDPSGRVARVMSVPRTQDAAALTGMMGATQYDPAGRLVYRSFGIGMQRPGGPGGPGGGVGGPVMRGGPGAGGGAFSVAPEIPDSAAIVRVDLTTRRLDTVAFIRTPPVRMRVTRSDDGTVTMQSEVNPLPVVDDWGVLNDGTIVIVRGADYRVELVAPDGSTRPASKIPFEWQRLSDDDKVEFMDSVKVAYERRRAAGEVSVPGLGGFGGGGGPQIVMRQRTGPGGGAPGGGTPGGGNAPAGMPVPEINFVPPDQLPDYRPAFFAGALRVDADGNLWVRTTRSTGGKGPIYDVISREGQLVDRVQIPADRTIAGFAPGAVYLSSRDGDAARLEVASLR